MRGKLFLAALPTVVVLLSVLLPLSSFAEEGRDAEMNISVGGSFARMVIKPKVKPVSEFKHKNIVKQGLDFSCGAASAATLLNYYLGEAVTEEKVINTMFKVGDVDKILERQGFSLLDIKKLSENMGYKAVGYKTDLEGLILLNKPCVLPIVLRDYKHFVIFRGVARGRVFLADPALGNTTLSIHEFEKMWYGNVALVIEPRNGRTNDGLKLREEDFQLVASDTIWKSTIRTPLPFTKGAREF
jgi:predicted double-glycine peptidase